MKAEIKRIQTVGFQFKQVVMEKYTFWIKSHCEFLMKSQ